MNPDSRIAPLKFNMKNTYYVKDNFCTIYKLKLHQLQRFMENCGYRRVGSPDEASAIISGVCAAFDADEARSVAIMKSSHRSGIPHFTIGCLTEVNRDRLIGDHCYNTWDFDKLARDLTGANVSDYASLPLPSRFATKEDYRVFDPKRRFVGITTGCGFDCSYCPHKLGAGQLESRSIKNIVTDVLLAQNEGATIIHLTGLDTASWGLDLGKHFSELIFQVLHHCDAGLDIHMAQYNPEGLGVGARFDGLAKAFSDPRVVDIQLPIQTASQRLLKLMNRNYELSTISNFISTVRVENPGAFFRTDIMVGFPTESTAELENTIDFVSDNFNEAAVYFYEPKEKTKAVALIQERGLQYFAREELRRRVEFASERLRSRGVLVHSGGQNISTLLKADREKCECATKCLE